jgi:hypothetical protein
VAIKVAAAVKISPIIALRKITIEVKLGGEEAVVVKN